MILAYASYCYFSAGNKSLNGLALWLVGSLIMLAVPLGGYAGFARLGRRLDFGKADKYELKREDDFLLQAVGFSQSSLFIYLNLVQSDVFINILKWLVPSIASLFFFVRGYAKIKNSPQYRYYSIWILVFVLSLSLDSLLFLLIPQVFLFGEDLNRFVLLPLCFSLHLPPLGLVRVLCSKRYGYPD